jgi:hypothetical protein
MTLRLLGSHRLLFAGRGQGWLWIGASVVVLLLIIILYRYERRLVSRRVGLGLLTLRLLAAAALVLALFEPIIARSYRETIRGRVIVGVDLSDSMATTDPGRSAEEARRLAKALRLSPAEPAEILTRREIARRLLESDAVTKIAAEHTVEVAGFARELVPGTLDAISRRLGRAPRPGDPAGSMTDWGPVLALALKESGQAPVLGVVLLTDGQQNGPTDPSPLVDRLAARGIPVYPILIGSPTPPRDVAVTAIRAPETVYKGDVASISATLKLDGFAGAEVPVTLERNGAPPLRQTIQAPTNGSRPMVTFRVPLDAPGPQPLTIAVAPPAEDGRPDNDRRTITIQVADDKARVLLIDDEPRWEFRYLRNALARDPHASVEAVVFHQPSSAASGTTTYSSSLPNAPASPSAEPDPLGSYDAILIGDIAPADLGPEGWGRLESYVAERGGTLILSPGPRHWPMSQSHEVIHKLLPVLDLRPVIFDPTAIDPQHSAQPPGVSIAPVASLDLTSWPMLQFAADPARSRAIWATLPRLPWVLSGRAKPGATVLASTTDVKNDDEEAVIAEQPYGLGKVLWVGTDGTWRWRQWVGDAYHHRFWGQIVRWAATGKLTAGNRSVRFGSLRPQVAEGDGARLQARITESVAGAGPDLLVVARIFKKSAARKSDLSLNDAIAVVPLRAVDGQPRTFEGQAPPLPLGSYFIRLDVPQLASALGLDGPGPIPEAALEISPRDTPERIELAARRDLLDRLATVTGGRVLAEHEFKELPNLLRARTIQVVRHEETTLWDRPGFLVVFFSLLTFEWILRKRAGLP